MEIHATSISADARRCDSAGLVPAGPGLVVIAAPRISDATGTRVPTGMFGDRGRLGVTGPISARARAMSVVS